MPSLRIRSGILHTTLATVLRLKLELLLIHRYDTDLGSTVVIQHVLVPEVDIDGVHHGKHVAHDGDEHGKVGIVIGDDGTRRRREHHAARDGGHET